MLSLHSVVSSQIEKKINKRQIGKMNQRIKALLDIKQYQHDDKIADYVKKKHNQAKIKRTQNLRKNHLIDIIDDTPLVKQHRQLSIETFKIQNSDNIQKQNHSWTIKQLKQFEDDFSKGKIDDKYQQMLDKYINQCDGFIDMSKQEFIKKATKEIKQKLFDYYIKQSHKKIDRRKHSTYQLSGNKFIQPSRSKQIKRPHVRMMSQNHLTKHHYKIKQQQSPYVLKSTSKFSKAYSQGLQSQYKSEIQNIDNSKKVNDKRRRINQQIFLTRLKQCKKIKTIKL